MLARVYTVTHNYWNALLVTVVMCISNSNQQNFIKLWPQLPHSLPH